MNDNTGEWFRTIIRVWQGCHLSPTVFNIFLERTVFDALEEHKWKAGGSCFTTLRLTDGTDILAKEEQKLEALNEKNPVDKPPHGIKYR